MSRRGRLPIYYFHLRNGDDVLLDPEGRELDIRSTVELATLVQARGLISQDALDGRIDLAYHLDVEDEAGLVVHSLPFSDAVEIVAG